MFEKQKGFRQSNPDSQAREYVPTLSGGQVLK